MVTAGRQVRPRMEVMAREGWGPGGCPPASPCPADQQPPHCSLLRAGLQEHPSPPHSGVSFAPRPSSPLYPSYLTPESLPIPLGALGRGTPASLPPTALSLLCFILKHSTLVASRMRGCAGIWGSGTQGPERAIAHLQLHSKA